MTREELREQLLKYYDVKTIVDRLFWNPDREKFLKELSDYQRSILERFFNPNKRLFQAYLKEQTLPYKEWNHYKEALDRAVALKEDILSRLFQRIEAEKEKKKKIARARKTSRAVYDGDDDLLTKAFLLFLLYEILKGNDTAKGEESEFKQEQDNQENKENSHLQQEQENAEQTKHEQLLEQTETTETEELKDSQTGKEKTPEPDNRSIEESTALFNETNSQYRELERDNTESLKDHNSSDSPADSHSSRDYDFSDSFGSYDSGDSYNSGSDWDSGSDWGGGGDW